MRFFGCNLSCKFCDTKLEHFDEYEPQELLSQLHKYPKVYHSVSFTGGEPLLQKDFLKEMLKLTKDSQIKNYLETNGTLPEALEEVIDDVDIVAMDLKLPSSTASGDFWQAHRKFLNIASRKEVFLKAVICHSTEEKDIKEVLSLIKESKTDPLLILQPNSDECDADLGKKIESIRKSCQNEKVKVRVIPQMHKVLGVR